MNDTVIGAETNFGYDPLNRLTSTTYNYSSGAVGYTYAYDRFGNRWSQTVTSGSGPQPSYTFNYNNNQITTAGYTYDAAGNMTYDGSHHYTYDAEGNILQVDSGQTATYVYDAMNRRVRSQTAAATYEYMYDYAGRRTSSWLNPSSGNPGTGNEGRIYWDGGQIAFRADDGTTYFEHQDWLGTERMRTNDAGAIAATYNSLPFGDASSAKLGGEDANQDNNLFASLDFDTESNTSHAQFRNYSQTQGRWLSPDPYYGSYNLTDPESLNRYAYVLNNPLSFIDPLGLDCYTIGADSWSITVGDTTTTGSDPGTTICTDPGTWQCQQYDYCGSNTSSNSSAPPTPTKPPAPSNGTQNSKPIIGQFFGTHYCGPGGSGDPVNSLDAACQAHDQCYDRNGLTPMSNFNPNLPFLQASALQACNAALCSAASKSNDLGATRVQLYFTLVPTVGYCSATR